MGGGSPKMAVDYCGDSNKMAVVKYQALSFVMMGTPVDSNIKECIEVGKYCITINRS